MDKKDPEEVMLETLAEEDLPKELIDAEEIEEKDD